MHLASFLLLASAAIFASAYPAAYENPTTIGPRAIEGPNTTTTQTGPVDPNFACDQTHSLLQQQVAEMAKLKEAKIAIPPYLAGYYSAVSSGHQAIGCPAINVRSKRQFTPIKEPCAVINEQHGRMAVLVDRFKKDHISIAPFLAGFLSATVDSNKGLRCPPFTAVSPDEADTADDGLTAAENDQVESAT